MSQMLYELVGVAGFEPAASSSRSQVASRAASTAACLTWERPSIDVRWRSPLTMAIVTHLVTRLGQAGLGHLDANYLHDPAQGQVV
jgi:hypothetical protein